MNLALTEDRYIRQLGPQLEVRLVSWEEQLRQEGRVEADRRNIMQALRLRFPKVNWSDINGLLMGKDATLLEEIHGIAVCATSVRQFQTQLAEKIRGEAAS